MRIRKPLIASIVLFVTCSLAQKAGPQISLSQNTTQTLTEFKQTLGPNQWAAVYKMEETKPSRTQICPDCTSVDDGQLVAHGIANPESGTGPKHILLPITEESRLEKINSTLWSTLNLLKGADKEYMGNYLAEEKSKAPTILEQIALRSKYIHQLVGKLNGTTAGSAN